MTTAKLQELCEEIRSSGVVHEAMVLLSKMAVEEHSDTVREAACSRTIIRTARKLVAARPRIDKATRDVLEGLLEVDE